MVNHSETVCIMFSSESGNKVGDKAVIDSRSITHQRNGGEGQFTAFRASNLSQNQRNDKRNVFMLLKR